MSNSGLNIPTAQQLKTKTGFEEKHSIAVLPFVNMSADPENEYFSDGITEEILNALTNIDGLKVTSRTSSFAFKGKKHSSLSWVFLLLFRPICRGYVVACFVPSIL